MLVQAATICQRDLLSDCSRSLPDACYHHDWQLHGGKLPVIANVTCRVGTQLAWEHCLVVLLLQWLHLVHDQAIKNSDPWLWCTSA